MVVFRISLAVFTKVEVIALAAVVSGSNDGVLFTVVARDAFMNGVDDALFGADDHRFSEVVVVFDELVDFLAQWFNLFGKGLIDDEFELFRSDRNVHLLRLVGIFSSEHNAGCHGLVENIVASLFMMHDLLLGRGNIDLDGLAEGLIYNDNELAVIEIVRNDDLVAFAVLVIELVV
jgi:hypothetical protein